jgi:aminopeptidase 2
VVFVNASRFGSIVEYEKLLKIYRKPPTPQHKTACMYGFCASRDPDLIRQTIEFMHSDEVKTQDLMYFFGGLASNRYARRQIWHDLQKGLADLVARFQGSMTLPRVILSGFERFSSEEDLKAIIDFFEDKDTKDFDQALKQGIDTVRAKIAWLKRDAKDVEDWLRESGKPMLVSHLSSAETLLLRPPLLNRCILPRPWL